MAIITNATRRTPLGLGGILIRPGESAEVESWEKLKGRKNIKAMVEAGDIQVGKAAADRAAKAAASEPPAPPTPEPEKDGKKDGPPSA